MHIHPSFTRQIPSGENMAVGIKYCNAPLKLSSNAFEKFIKTRRNLSKPSPTLLYDTPHIDFHDQDRNGLRTLTLSHPILRILDSCAPNLRHFNQIHTQLLMLGLFQNSLTASRATMKLCSSESTIFRAVELFDNFASPDAFLCNTIIRGFVNFNNPEKGLDFYWGKMVKNSIFQNNYTFPIALKACADLGLLMEGRRIHSQVVKCGFELDLYVRNSLIRVYSVCYEIGDAWKVFVSSSHLDLVTWNTMIDGYVKNEDVNGARWIFDSMKERDIVSWNTIISGYVGVGDMDTAKSLFEEMPCRDVVSWNSMIDGYARIGDEKAARKLFDQMGDKRNTISWNTILALYVRLKDYNECLRLFDRMVTKGDSLLNEAVLVSVLTSCAHLGSLDRGEWIYSYIKLNGSIEPDVLLLTTLLTMFAKCGNMDLAKEVFDEMPEKNIVSWNSIIMGYGLNGQGDKALAMFLEMEKCGLAPNDATFTSVLSACTHCGMVLEGWWYFDLMHRVYGIEPKIEHYGCMVDLLGRAGLTKDSEELLWNVPIMSAPPLWGALLSACQTHSNVELGEIVAKRLIGIRPGDIGPYVLLSNIYAAEGRWDDVENVRMMIKNNETEKLAGSSQIHSIDSKDYPSHENRSVHKRSMLYSMLSEIGVQMKLSCRQ